MSRPALPGSRIFRSRPLFQEKGRDRSKRGFLKIPLPGLPLSILLLLLFFFLLGQSYLEAKGRVRRLELLESEVETLRDRKTELEEELTYRQSPDYIEKEAREQLGYTKKGEVIVVLPDFEESSFAEASEEGETPAAETWARELPLWRRNLAAWGCLFIPSSWTCP